MEKREWEQLEAGAAHFIATIWSKRESAIQLSSVCRILVQEWRESEETAVPDVQFQDLATVTGRAGHFTDTVTKVLKEW